MLFVLGLLVAVTATTPDAWPSNPPSPNSAVAKKPPQAKPGDQRSEPNRSQQGTEHDPLVVKVVPVPKSDAEAAQDAEDRKNKSFSDGWTVRFAGAAVIVGIVQSWVFYIQARRLKQTIVTMQAISRDQSNDVRDSIAQATRAAIAMEGMSAGMIKSTGITTEIGRTQREFGQMQMRAYLTVIYGLTVPQDDTTGHFAEIRFQLINNGHTPAYGVSYKADAGILPFPLPDDFSFPIRDFPISSESVVGPGQNLVISCIIRDRLSPEQMEQCLRGDSLRLYMWGIATYRDAFNTARQTTFSQSVVWLRNGHSMGVNTRRHNEAT